jgi:drug/metabolite transporter (DMT)-like permease
MGQKKYWVYLLVTTAMLCWSLTYIWYKVVFTVLSPISVMAFRLTFSAVFLFVFSILTHKLNHLQKPDIKWFVLLSFFQPFLYFLFEGYGVSKVSATLASVIISTIPVFTPIIARVFFNERLSIYNLFGIILSFIGVTFVSLGSQLHFDGSSIGVLLLFGAVASSLGYAVLITRLTIQYNSFTIISWQNAFGALWFLPLFFIFEFPKINITLINRHIFLNLIYLSFFGSTLAYILFTYSIKKLGITRASLFTNTIPVFTAIFSYFFLKEILEPIKITGIVIVLSGLFLAQIKKNN